MPDTNLQLQHCPRQNSFKILSIAVIANRYNRICSVQCPRLGYNSRLFITESDGIQSTVSGKHVSSAIGLRTYPGHLDYIIYI